jgi:transposase
MHKRKHQITNIADAMTPDDASQGARRATEAVAFGAARPDPEVVPLASRRSFSKGEKHRILTAADACVAPGDIGALLRREGIYSSHLATWRKQRNTAEEALLVERKRGPKVQPGAADARLIAQLTRDNERLRHKLVQADLIIDVQKKLATLLGLTTTDTPSEPKS